MIEKFDLMVYCKSVFDTILDESAKERMRNYFKKCDPSYILPDEKKENIPSELDKYKGFESYVYEMSKIYKILTIRSLLPVTKEDEEYFRRRNYDVYVSYVWNKSFSEEIPMPYHANPISELKKFNIKRLKPTLSCSESGSFSFIEM